MTLDEAIEHAREVADENRKVCNLAWIWNNPDNIKKCAEEHEQLAEWLEELKAYREIGTVEECKNSVLDIARAYNKAIDDFAKRLKEEYKETITTESVYISPFDEIVDEITEQLKLGVNNNENNI